MSKCQNSTVLSRFGIKNVKTELFSFDIFLCQNGTKLFSFDIYFVKLSKRDKTVQF
jgi:hypothetical protein